MSEADLRQMVTLLEGRVAALERMIGGPLSQVEPPVSEDWPRQPSWRGRAIQFTALAGHLAKQDELLGRMDEKLDKILRRIGRGDDA